MPSGELEMGGDTWGRVRAGGRNGCRIEDGVGMRVMGGLEVVGFQVGVVRSGLGMQMWFLCW